MPTYYGQIDEIDAEIVLVNEDRMVSDVDLSEYAKVKSVYTIGSTGFQLSASVDVTHIESKSTLTRKNYFEKVLVPEF